MKNEEVGGTMNNKRREKLKKALELVEKACAIIENAADDEQDCMDNTPEALQSGERYESLEQACDALACAQEHCQMVCELVESAIA